LEKQTDKHKAQSEVCHLYNIRNFISRQGYFGLPKDQICYPKFGEVFAQRSWWFVVKCRI